MLRRPATSIKLTPEDVLEYDDYLSLQQQHMNERIQQQQQIQQQHQQHLANSSNLQEQHDNSGIDIDVRNSRIGVKREN
ncbi:uncharacterized protein RJT21DRAFT_125779 [Scheffersomyces amazonensis]|uniref:uncharacterized protein n=1 Tax=Scheffersomyces amazonensis TaxID=1078765 RepID=UPI00315CE17A